MGFFSKRTRDYRCKSKAWAALAALAGRFAAERAEGFSAWGRMAMRVLCDPRLGPGMARGEVVAVAGRVIGGLGAA